MVPTEYGKMPVTMPGDGRFRYRVGLQIGGESIAGRAEPTRCRSAPIK